MASVDAGVRRRLFMAREAAKFTIKDAAKELGMTRQRLSRCESGESSPTPEELRAMCILYGASPGYMLFGADVSGVFGRAMRKAAGDPAPER